MIVWSDICRKNSIRGKALVRKNGVSDDKIALTDIYNIV